VLKQVGLRRNHVLLNTQQLITGKHFTMACTPFFFFS